MLFFLLGREWEEGCRTDFLDGLFGPTSPLKKSDFVWTFGATGADEILFQLVHMYTRYPPLWQVYLSNRTLIARSIH